MPTEIGFRSIHSRAFEAVAEDNPFPVELQNAPKAVLRFSERVTTGALALSSAVQIKIFLLREVRCKFSSAPVTSENFTVTLDSGDHSDFDTVLLSTDPSATAAASLHWIPEEKIFIMPDDQVDIAYANSDGRTIGCDLILEEY